MRKMFVLAVAAALAVAIGVAVAQQAPPEYVSGPAYTATALDTLWSSYSKASGVAAAKWFGPEKVYRAKNNGDWTSSKSMPVAYFLYAGEPFSVKTFNVDGDSVGVVSILVDSIPEACYQANDIVRSVHADPCQLFVGHPISQMRLNPASGDSVRVVPLYARE